MRISGWSSDVCSSDLPALDDARMRHPARTISEAHWGAPSTRTLANERAAPCTGAARDSFVPGCPGRRYQLPVKRTEILRGSHSLLESRTRKIGRASCREKGGKKV